ncbi:hypothetical protein C7E20_19010 [Sphingobium sp. AEW4]|nr:hypothetical protein C7E20_19010 [Sphingobium sp. AEW4]
MAFMMRSPKTDALRTGSLPLQCYSSEANMTEMLRFPAFYSSPPAHGTELSQIEGASFYFVMLNLFQHPSRAMSLRL